MKLTALTDLLTEAAREWVNDSAARFGAALAYYTMFSIAPILLICTAVAGLVFGKEAAQGQLLDQARDLVGDEGAAALQSMLASAGQWDAGIWAAVSGFAMIVIGAIGLFGELQAALNAIWNVRPKSNRGWKYFLYDRLLSFSMVLGTAFLLLVSLVVSAFLAGLTSRLDEYAIAPILNLAISFGVFTVLFAMIFRFLPDAVIAWSDVWLGAVVTSLLFAAGRYAIGLYLGQSAIHSAYGAAGSLAALLVWVYYAALVFLFGAEITKVYAKRYGSGIVPKETAVAVERPVEV